MISLIAIVGQNNELGYQGKLLWDIPEDLAYFHKITQNHTVIMGRKTFESIGRVLKNRRNIVMTKNEKWKYEGVETANSLDEVLKKIDNSEENFVIGGSEIYQLFALYAQKIYLTKVKSSHIADVFFVDCADFLEINNIEKTSGDLSYSVKILEKINYEK